MDLTGCWCFDADDLNIRSAAHHIFPKNSIYDDGKAALQCLREKRGIDVDSALNGVCLPNVDQEYSDAFPHKGGESELHGPEQMAALLKLCEDDSINDEEFKTILREIADSYTKGIFFIFP